MKITILLGFFQKQNTLTYPQLIKFLTDLNESQVQFAPKVVCKTAVIIMETKVG